MYTLSRLNLLLAALGLVVVCVITGCSTVSGPASASFASVTIQNHSPEQVAGVTAQVFAADGYRGGMTGPGQMVFEKEASRATAFAREGIVNASYGASTINRVRVEILSVGAGICRVQCKAYMVTGGSDPFFQDEVPLANIRSGPYQSLLNKVAGQLK